MHNQRIIDHDAMGKVFDNPMGKLFDHPLMKHQVTGNQFVKNAQGEIRLRGDSLPDTFITHFDIDI